MEATVTNHRFTVDVETAGKLLGISRNSAFKAANEGSLPGVIRIGRRFVVSVPALEKALGADPGALGHERTAPSISR
jgi:hypothetical protein